MFISYLFVKLHILFILTYFYNAIKNRLQAFYIDHVVFITLEQALIFSTFIKYEELVHFISLLYAALHISSYLQLFLYFNNNFI